jgi:hypothetical protein
MHNKVISTSMSVLLGGHSGIRTNQKQTAKAFP